MTHTGLASADRDAFVRAMRRVANSVAVVTTDGIAGRHGATVSAFASLSADPPMILVCLRSASRIAQAVAANRTMCLNILAEDRVDLASRFAGKDDHQVEDRFLGVDISTGHGIAPEIEGATRFAGVVGQTVAAGSHSIFVCLVHRVSQTEATPLVYLDGSYLSLAQPTHPAPKGAAS